MMTEKKVYHRSPRYEICSQTNHFWVLIRQTEFIVMMTKEFYHICKFHYHRGRVFVLVHDHYIHKWKCTISLEIFFSTPLSYARALQYCSYSENEFL